MTDFFSCVLKVLKGAGKETLTSFTQEEVNLGMVLYQHQDPGSTNDSLLLDATNGVTEIGPIKVEIEVIPNLIPLKVDNLFSTLKTNICPSAKVVFSLAK